MRLLNFISIYSILLPVCIGLLFIKKLSRDSILIFIIAFIGAIPQLLSPSFHETKFLSIAYNLYVLIEFIIMCFLFKNKFFHKKTIKIFLYTIFFYSLLVVILILINGIIFRFLSEWICLNSLIYISWILLLILEQYDDVLLNLTPFTSFFWYILGIFLYSSCTMLLFSLWNYMENVSVELKVIHQIFNTILYVMFTIGFFIDYKLTRKTL